jgi:hypothetical protein
MKTQKFQTLSDTAKADPVRRSNIERFRDEALVEVIQFQLDELRKLRGMTQVELARALGSNQPNVS